MKRAAGLLLALFLALQAWAAPAHTRIFDAETFTLDNGLQVVVITNDRAPIVTHMLWYKVGAADETPGKSGLAHFLEHLMFKGTDKLAPGEFSEIIALNGGQENAFTSSDYTGYHQTVAKDRLEIMMQHEADRMTNLNLSDEVVLPEREVVLEERRQRVDNDPGAQLWEVSRRALYLNHPYGIPTIGWEHEASALTSEDAIAFYRRWYAPNNAILIVAGDVTPEEVRPLAEKYYGVIPQRDVPPRLRPSEPEHMAARRVILESPRVQQPQIAINYLAPSYRADPTGDAYALQVLDEVLGGGATSRLYKSLVVEQQVAASAGSHYSASSYDETSFGFFVSPSPGVSPESAEAALRAELARLLAEGVSEEEVARAKQRLVAAAVYARDSLTTAPRIFGVALTTGSSVEDVQSWADRIDAVGTEQVNAAIPRLLRDERSVTNLLLNKPNS